MRKMTRDKVRGMLVGGAIGDAIGMPVETWSPSKIREVHPNGITGYLPPIGHKWFKPEEMPAGETTDDTQLTVATMEGLINGHAEAMKQQKFDPYMDAIALAHVEASQKTVAGWGKTTQEAVARLANGVPWSISGMTDEVHRGTGNGIPMKCSPLAVWNGTKVGGDFKEVGIDLLFNQKVVEFAAMTHWNQISGHAGVMHVTAIYLCLWETPDTFVDKYFTDLIADTVWEWHNDPDALPNYYRVDHLPPCEDDLRARLTQLAQLRMSGQLAKMTVEEIRLLFGGGSCYVYDSLPFAYAFFLRDHQTAASILRTAEAGGDTDTNAKIVGEMIGALHGLQLFEQQQNRWMLDGLIDFNELLALADRFCDTFNVEA